MNACAWRGTFAGVAVCLTVLGSCGGGRSSNVDAPTSVPFSSPSEIGSAGQRYGSQSSASTTDGAAWEFSEGLSVRITGATRVSSRLSPRARRDAGLVVVRIDFSYTNNGSAVNLSEGRQQPVRLLYGEARIEGEAVGGYIGTSDQLTLQAPTRVNRGATVRGAVSFAVPTSEVDVLAVLVVEPRRYTEHLFTDVQDLLDLS